ncbi:MAG: UDP-3-O-(3-hydroxymyristoyl)glucosamine N-acyltransferase [Bacteroidales bacterium]|jgi:UDP-3-O-[3-hydroxymyristoyl] glucosamine N-acyltransferase|nr:UDP-3-O-(3-hydroxymyristoyl)glucosamine N-acyltransferase [Bacteroidales bacterium]
MKFTAEQIAEAIGGKIEGDPEVIIDKLSKIEEGTPGSISFLGNPKYTHYIYTTKASVVIVPTAFMPGNPVSTTLLRVDDPYSAFSKILAFYQAQKPRRNGISQKASVSPDATIGENVYIGDFAVIEANVTIGDNAMIYPNSTVETGANIGQNTIIYSGVQIKEDSMVGNHCIIHSGVVIGADGFGFAPQSDKHYEKVAQIGNVIIEDYVEIGANTTIDKATMGSTIIRKGVKLDNLIQIGHNVVIGENTVIAAQTGVSGSTKIGKNCMIAGQVGIVGHITIGDNAVIAAQSGVGNSVPDNAIIFGSPAIDANKHKKVLIHMRNLDKHVKRIDILEEKLKNL